MAKHGLAPLVAGASEHENKMGLLGDRRIPIGTTAEGERVPISGHCGQIKDVPNQARRQFPLSLTSLGCVHLFCGRSLGGM